MVTSVATKIESLYFVHIVGVGGGGNNTEKTCSSKYFYPYSIDYIYTLQNYHMLIHPL